MAPKRARGFSMIEMMVCLAIVSFLIAVVFGLLGNAQSSFFNTDTGIDLRNSLRMASMKMTSELRNTGYKAGVAQFSILDGSGTGGSDIIRFAIPILCSTTSTLLDASGNPAYWGAPLTWGCNSSACMDANDNCAVQEYRYLQYSINASNQLERTVLDSALATVAGGVSVVGQNITDLQASVTSNELTVTLTGQKASAVKKTITTSYSNKIQLNNLGG